MVFPNAGFGEAPTDSNFLIQNVSAKHSLVGTVEPPTGPFSFGPGSGGPFTFPPLGIRKVKLRFTPTGLGPETDTLTVLSNDPMHSEVPVNLKGSGKPGVPTLSVPSLSFGPVGIGIAPAPTRTLKIHNTGLGVLNGSVDPIGGPVRGYHRSGSIRSNRSGRGANRESAVQADRCGSGAHYACDQCRQPGHPTIMVPVSGTGKPGVLATSILTPNNQGLIPFLAFDKVKHAKTLSKSFKIENIGKGDLQGTIPTYTAPFTVTHGLGVFDLAPGQMKKVTIEFAPLTPIGKTSQQLVILVNSPGETARRDHAVG